MLNFRPLILFWVTTRVSEHEQVYMNAISTTSEKKQDTTTAHVNALSDGSKVKRTFL